MLQYKAGDEAKIIQSLVLGKLLFDTSFNFLKFCCYENNQAINAFLILRKVG